MNVHTYRYSEAKNLPGLSIGVTRQAPRGVRKEERVSRGFFDVWLPMLGPSRELLAAFRAKEMTFSAFTRRYRAEMKRPEARQAIALLAAVSKSQRINLGCFCCDPERCHRSILRDLIMAEVPKAESEGDDNPPDDDEPIECSSAPCYAAQFSEDLFTDDR
jgi:uncharacterized protein YeaO (DUF488 family)